MWHDIAGGWSIHALQLIPSGMIERKVIGICPVLIDETFCDEPMTNSFPFVGSFLFKQEVFTFVSPYPVLIVVMVLSFFSAVCSWIAVIGWCQPIEWSPEKRTIWVIIKNIDYELVIDARPDQGTAGPWAWAGWGAPLPPVGLSASFCLYHCPCILQILI